MVKIFLCCVLILCSIAFGVTQLSAGYDAPSVAVTQTTDLTPEEIQQKLYDLLNRVEYLERELAALRGEGNQNGNGNGNGDGNIMSRQLLSIIFAGVLLVSGVGLMIFLHLNNKKKKENISDIETHGSK